MENKVITIWGNHEFACEIAYCFAKLTELNVCLLDLDFLCPSVDLHLGVAKYPDKIILNKDSTGYDILEHSIENNCMNADIIVDASVGKWELKNLFIITGCYDIGKHEYYSFESLVNIIDICKQSFGITIIIINKSMYDMFSVASLYKADINLIGLNAVTEEIRQFNNQIHALQEKQDIPSDKYKYVAFDYDSDRNIDEGLLKELTANSFLGVISSSKNRDQAIKYNKPYCFNMDNKILMQYKGLLNKLGYVPKLLLKEKIISKFGKDDSIRKEN